MYLKMIYFILYSYGIVLIILKTVKKNSGL